MEDQLKQQEIYTRKEQPALFLLLMVVAVLYLFTRFTAQNVIEFDDSFTEADLRTGVLTAYALFVTLCTSTMPNLSLTFPNPLFWKVIYATVAFYTLGIASFILLSRDSARDVIRIVFEGEGMPKSFDDFEASIQAKIDDVMGTCDISSKTLFRQIFVAPWFFSHVAGWAAKVLIFRDFWTAFTAAVMFEIAEVTLEYVVPEFEECWWDSLFLDTLGANLIGLLIGLIIRSWLAHFSDDWRHLDWLGKEERISEGSKLFYSVTPIAVSKYEWKVLKSPMRLLQVFTLCSVMVIAEINLFVMANSLGIPLSTASLFCHGRLASLGFLSSIAAADFFEYINNCSPNTMGPSISLLILMLSVEIAVNIKFFPRHMMAEVEKVDNFV